MAMLRGERSHHSSLLQALIAIQDKKGFISEEDASAVSLRFDVSVSQVLSLIAFYRFLLDRDHGPYRFLFSDNITDRMAGSEELMQQLCTHLCVRPGKINRAAGVYVNTTSCTGMADQGPAALVNGRPLNKLTPQRISQIAGLVDAQVPVALWPARFFHIENRICHAGPLLSDAPDLPDPVARLRGKGAEWFLGELAASGLRGLAGSGFPAATKWRCCRATEAETRVVICNADEGEPGAFKDRVLLTDYIDDVLAGMAIAAEVVGAGLGFIYLRGEYAYLRPAIDEAISRAYRNGTLPDSFDLAVHLGAGAYVCGEETALIESLEGKRGIPRQRPPYPAESGYLSLPTLVHNVESFLSVARIAQHGGDWLRRHGTARSPGTRLLSISGDCENPGVYEVPYGSSVDEVLRLCGGAGAQAVQIAGGTGQTVPRSRFGHVLSHEDIAAGASFMVIGADRDLTVLLENMATFFERESCGFCTPCRTGCPQLTRLAGKLRRGRATEADLARVSEIAAMLKNVAFCDLGASAANTFEDLIRYFPDVIREHTEGGAAAPEPASAGQKTRRRESESRKVMPL
ncbi:NADH-ubiquinone oxidoreductase-F iron-sulfur binding region domain-containing protein [Granulosicoccaceae sp. 1_MG-2023]|nr:NADH-ubiquinone oxidoreductase-F iron-sulfur binding region domain-containing protein [Granulosicoccaceae sp. 1_MG-2023]